MTLRHLYTVATQVITIPIVFSALSVLRGALIAQPWARADRIGTAHDKQGQTRDENPPFA